MTTYHLSAPVAFPPPRRQKIETKWSSEQLAIFDYMRNGNGNCVIKARAGTGKTHTSIHGLASAPERQMLYAQFNKKNQLEASGKIRDHRIEVRTLHSVGFRCIAQHWPGSKPDDTIEFGRLQSVDINVPKEMVSPILKLLAFAKNCFIAPSEDDLVLLAEERMPDAEWSGIYSADFCAGLVLEILELSKQQDDQLRISFNDMVWLPVALNLIRPRYDLVLIDEAQDMNLPQLTMAIRSSRGRIIVVGDDRQCIYGFRGAVHDGLSLMRNELKAAELGLTTTYRCPRKVVELAKKFVPDYNAAPEAPEGIVDSVSESKLCDVVKIGDAILSRANAPLMPLALSLIRRNIPARIEGKDIGKQLLALVQKMKARSIPDFIGKVSAWATRMKSRLLKKQNCESKLDLIDDQKETLCAVAEGLKSVSEIEQRIRDLFDDSDSNGKPAVILSTVHKAKGLEWRRVFLVRETFLKRQNREEENIYYVALTRAKEHLTFIGGEPEQKET